MQNWESVEKATNNAKDSAGSANKEQEAYLNSVKGKLAQLNSAFQQLSEGTIDSGTIKGFVELLTIIVKLIDKVGLLNIAVVALFAVLNRKSEFTLLGHLINFSSVLKNGGIHLKSMMKSFSGFNTVLKNTGKTAGSTATSVTALGTAEAGATIPTITLAGAMATLMGTILPLILIIGTIGLAYEALTNFIDDNSNIQEKNVQATQEAVDVTTDLKQQLEELSNIENKTKDDERKIQLLQKKLEIYEAIAKQKALETAESKFDGDVGFFDKAGVVIESGVTPATGEHKASLLDRSGYGIKAIQQRIAVIEDLRKKELELEEAILKVNASDKDAQEQIDKLNEKLADNYTQQMTTSDGLLKGIEATDQAIEANYKFSESELTVINKGNELLLTNNSLVESTMTVGEAIGDLGNASDVITNTFSGMTEAMSLVSGAMKEMDSDGQLSLETVMKMIESGTEYINLLDFENGIYTLNGEKVAYLFEQKKASAIGEIEQKRQLTKSLLTYMKGEVEAYEAGSIADKARAENAKNSAINAIGAVGSMGQSILAMLDATGNSAIGALQKQATDFINNLPEIDGSNVNQYRNAIKDLEGQLTQYDSAIEVLSNTTLPEFVGTADTVNDKIKEQEKTAKSASDTIENEYNKAIKENEKLQKQLEKQIKATNAELDKENDNFDNKQKGYELYVKEIIKILEKEISALNEQKETREAFYDAEIDAIQAKIDLLDETTEKEDELNKIEEARLEIIKRQQALEDIRKNKNVKVYKEGKICPKFTISVKRQRCLRPR